MIIENCRYKYGRTEVKEMSHGPAETTPTISWMLWALKGVALRFASHLLFLHFIFYQLDKLFYSMSHSWRTLLHKGRPNHVVTLSPVLCSKILVSEQGPPQLASTAEPNHLEPGPLWDSHSPEYQMIVFQRSSVHPTVTLWKNIRKLNLRVHVAWHARYLRIRTP